MKTLTGRTPLKDAAPTAFLRLIADNKWASKRALELWLSNQNWRNAVIKKLQDEGLIVSINLNEKAREKQKRARKAGAVRASELPPRVYGRRFALTAKGRRYLSEYNKRRYGRLADSSLGSNTYEPRKIYRQSLLSEMRAMSELAGYCVHSQEKPFVVILSNHPVSLADRPAFTAFTPSEIPERFRGFENTTHNQVPFLYYDKNKRTRYGCEPRDTRQYIYRETPVGCVYTLPELLALAQAETEVYGGTQGELDRLKYTRLSGLLFTGHGAYRLYNTERTAPRLRKNGEDSMKIFLDSWAAHVYKQSLTELRYDGRGGYTEEFTPERLKGAILFGDGTHQAALSVLRNTWDTELWNARGKLANKVVQNYNLHTISDTHFLPVIQEAIPLYSMMIFPHWPSWVKRMGQQYLELLAGRGEAPTLAREYIGDHMWNGELSDGSYMVTLAALHLDTVYEIVGRISSGERYTFMAMEWQRPFFNALTEMLPLEGAEQLTIHYMPQNKLEDFARDLHGRNENPYNG